MWCAVGELIIRSVRMIPETKGRSLEEMDVVFGAVSSEARQALIQREERALGNANEASSSSSYEAKA